jgi:hypothetical protein
METYLKAGDIRRQTGLSRASVARLAAQGKIPGAWRVDGHHFAFADTPQLRSWIETQRSKRKMEDLRGFRKAGRSSSSHQQGRTGIYTIEAIHMDFLRWKSLVAGDGFPQEWTTGELEKIRSDLNPFKSTIAELEEELNRRGGEVSAGRFVRTGRAEARGGG